MLKLLLELLIIAVIYIVPIVCRAFLHWVQGFAVLGVVVFLLAPHTDPADYTAELTAFVVWVLGSLTALSLQIRDRGEQGKREHEAEYHHSRKEPFK